ESPGVGAFAFPGNEFLLGKAKEAFDENNQLKDEGTVKFLRSVLEKFVRFVNIIQQIEGDKPTVIEPEDLNATGKSATTIEGVDMYAEDWVEQAAAYISTPSIVVALFPVAFKSSGKSATTIEGVDMYAAA